MLSIGGVGTNCIGQPTDEGFGYVREFRFNRNSKV